MTNDDIKTIRRGLNTVTPDWQEVEIQNARAALDRLEARLNQANAKWKEYWQGEKEATAEVERLRTQAVNVKEQYDKVYDERERLRKQWEESFAGKIGRLGIELEDEVERLRAENAQAREYARLLEDAATFDEAEKQKLREKDAVTQELWGRAEDEVKRLKAFERNPDEEVERLVKEVERLRDALARVRNERNDFIEARRLDLEEVERLRCVDCGGSLYEKGAPAICAMGHVPGLRDEVERLRGIIEQYEETSPV
jgi:archaellum component FlaC